MNKAKRLGTKTNTVLKSDYFQYLQARRYFTDKVEKRLLYRGK